MESVFDEKDFIKLKNGLKFQVAKVFYVDEVEHYYLLNVNEGADPKNPEMVIGREEYVDGKFLLKILSDEKEIETAFTYLKEAIESEKHD